MKLSPEALALCKSGPLDIDDLMPLLPALTDEIVAHGDVEVVQRCQAARVLCATPIAAADCVKAYYSDSTPTSARVHFLAPG